MIWRVGAFAGAALPVMAQAASGAATPSAPVVWHVLGYPFEAGSMIAAVCACIAVRFYVSQSTPAHRWMLDLPVSALSAMFTAGAIISLRPAPLTALLLGTGLGAVGAGLIKIGKSYVDRWLGDTAGD